MTTIDQVRRVSAPRPHSLLSVKQAATYLGVSDSTIRRLVRSEELTALRVGAQLRFEQRELERLAAGRGGRRERASDSWSGETEIPGWAKEKVSGWKKALEDLLPDPDRTQVVVIDRRGAKAFSMLRPEGFSWGVNLWHSTALDSQSDAQVRALFEGREVVVFDEMIQRGRDVEDVRSRLEELRVDVRSVCLVRRRKMFLFGEIADPYLQPIEDLPEIEFAAAATFLSRLFDYCQPPLDPEHLVITGRLAEPLSPEQVRERLQPHGIAGVVWNRQASEDSFVAAVTLDRPQFLDVGGVAPQVGLEQVWDGPCKIRCYIAEGGRRITIAFIAFPTLSGDRGAWRSLVEHTRRRYGGRTQSAAEPLGELTPKEVEHAYVDACTDLSVRLLEQAVAAGMMAGLGMGELKGPGDDELAAFFGDSRAKEMGRQIEEALAGAEAASLPLPVERTVPLFVDVDRSVSRTTDPERAQRQVVESLPTRHPEGGAAAPVDTPVGIPYRELLERLRPLEETVVSTALDGLLDGVRAKPVNVVHEIEGGWQVARAFAGSEYGPEDPYDARQIKRTQAAALLALQHWLRLRDLDDETGIHVAKLLVNLVHDWGSEPLAIENYPYKHGMLPGLDARVPWRTDGPRYLLNELRTAGLLERRRAPRSARFSLPERLDVAGFAESAGLTGHERAQIKSLVQTYALIQERCKVNRPRGPGREIVPFKDPLVALSSVRNEAVAYVCAEFEIGDWVETGRRLFQMLNVHAELGRPTPQYRQAVREHVIQFAQAARFLFEKLSMYSALPDLRRQLQALFEQEELYTGDILLESIDPESRFELDYAATDHPVGLLRWAISVVRPFSSMVRQVLTEFGLDEDTRPADARQARVGEGVVAKDMDYYAKQLSDALDEGVVAAEVGRVMKLARRADGDLRRQQDTIDRLQESFERVVEVLQSRIKSGQRVEEERRRQDERTRDLIRVGRWFEAQPRLRDADCVVAVGDFYNFVNFVKGSASLMDMPEGEVADRLQERMERAVDGLREHCPDVVSQVSTDTCVLVAEDVDELLIAVEAINKSFRREIRSWDSGARLAYTRFGMTRREGQFFSALSAALKLGERAGFPRGTIVMSEEVHERLGPIGAGRCRRREATDDNPALYYIPDEAEGGADPA
jgi:excisionase family DNA binding protein